MRIQKDIVWPGKFLYKISAGQMQNDAAIETGLRTPMPVIP